jgi:hypothetical protein
VWFGEFGNNGCVSLRLIAARRIIPSLIALLGVAGVWAAGASGLPARTVTVVPGSAEVAGHDYGFWERASQRWRLTLPLSTATRNTSCLRHPPQGPVWFLNWTSRATDISCAIPAGKYLMITALTVDCSTVEAPPFHASTDAGLRHCAEREWAKSGAYASVRLDGKKLRPSGYVTQTGAFKFQMPSRHNLLLVPGHTRGRTAIVGLSTIFSPLKPGPHTLTVASGFRNARPPRFPTNTIHLTVR